VLKYVSNKGGITMKMPISVLNSMVPNVKGKKVSLYYLNSSLLAKKFLGLSDYEKRMKVERYEYGKKTTGITALNLPVDILETERGFEAYVEPIIPGTLEGELTTFCDYLNEHRYDITLDEITNYILLVANAVEECHKNKIVNPDMASDGNVLYHKGAGKVYLTDFQDMQVGSIGTKAISDFIVTDPILSKPKYTQGDRYSKNIDLYTLAIRYFYYATKLNLPRAAMFGVSFDDILRGTGIEHSELAKCIRRLHNPNKDNIDIRGPIEEINKRYVISKFKEGEPRHFIRK